MPSLAVAPSPSVAWLNNLVEAVDTFREIHPDMTLNQVLVFLLTASHPGITQRELMEMTGLSDSSASRIVATLGQHGNRGTGPFHLIELVEHRNDRRLKIVRLTKRGQALASRLAEAIRRGHTR